ncbi:hypothetical protein BT69DRAFT_1348812 [Atractiella rhizophila]|nr:hypothetical protein BT69DRAFT_1348812 [Atractiella rhizophila]
MSNNSLSRQPSSLSTNSSSAPPKRKAKNLLREYYGLQHPQSPVTPKAFQHGEVQGDPLMIDTSAFEPQTYFKHIADTASVPELLKKHEELLSEIRELDGERQSLVYNHHHELIDGSDTIKKLNSRADSLDSTLDRLRTSFSTISQLSSTLSLPAPKPPSRTFSPIEHLPPLLSLPLVLRNLLEQSKDKEAREVWGRWEPVLKEWKDARVEGAEEIERECRDVFGAMRLRRVSMGDEEGRRSIESASVY